MTSTPDHEVAIIGGGFSGIGAAILLDGPASTTT